MISECRGSSQQLTVDFDDEIFFLQRRGGISRYFTEVIRVFNDDPTLGITPRLTFTRSANEPLRKSSAGRYLLEQSTMPELIARLAGRWRLSNDLARTWQVGRALGPPGRIMQATYWSPRLRDLRAHAKVAVSVMDLIPEKLGALHFAGPFSGREQVLRRADIVFTISDATRDDLLDWYPWIGVPVITTPLAADSTVFASEPTPGEHTPSYPYALFVGKREGYKNFDVFMAAIGMVRALGLDLGIVAAGPVAAPSVALAHGSDIPSDRITFLEPTDAELAALYRGAALFVFPSSMEGFGLPILEAMSCGCPVVLSDISVFREVAGNAAVFAEVGSVEGFANAISKVLTSDSLRKSCVTDGFARAATFTWQSTAMVTAEGYRQACDG